MRLQKAEWLAAFIQAHNKTFTEQNIKGGFRVTGIQPFLPTKVLNCVSRQTAPSVQIPSATPSPAPTPFNDSVLTSSPVDINAVRTANAALNDLVATGDPFNTPANQLSDPKF